MLLNKEEVLLRSNNTWSRINLEVFELFVFPINTNDKADKLRNDNKKINQLHGALEHALQSSEDFKANTHEN